MGVHSVRSDCSDVEKEIAMLQLLRGHENVVRLETVWEDGPKSCLLMELCGQTLEKFLCDRRLPEKCALPLFTNILLVPLLLLLPFLSVFCIYRFTTFTLLYFTKYTPYSTSLSVPSQM